MKVCKRWHSRRAMCLEWKRDNARLPGWYCYRVNQMRKKNYAPTMYHKPGTPKSRHAPASSPSLSRPQIGEQRWATSSPHTLLIWLLMPENLTKSHQISESMLAIWTKFTQSHKSQHLQATRCRSRTECRSLLTLWSDCRSLVWFFHLQWGGLLRHLHKSEKIRRRQQEPCNIPR